MTPRLRTIPPTPGVTPDPEPPSDERHLLGLASSHDRHWPEEPAWHRVLREIRDEAQLNARSLDTRLQVATLMTLAAESDSEKLASLQARREIRDEWNAHQAVAVAVQAAIERIARAEGEGR